LGIFLKFGLDFTGKISDVQFFGSALGLVQYCTGLFFAFPEGMIEGYKPSRGKG
jgi:hypothetical protein